MKLKQLVAVFSLFFVLSLVSCDKEFSDVGADLVGDEHFGLNTTTYDVTAYNQATGDVQTNDMAIQSLGYYNNPVFGKTKASIVTQLELASTNPKFYAPEAVDSVYMHIPYYTTITDLDDSGAPIYRLDSLLPAFDETNTPKIKLSVFESGYYIQDYDPSTNLQQVQRYYSNQQSEFEAVIANGGQRLNDDNSNPKDATITDYSQNDQFVFSNKPIVFYKTNGDVRETLAPGMYMNLNKSFFQNKFYNAPSGSLLNNNTFKNYFRGLFFKVESASGSDNQGTLARLNITRGTITVVYKDFQSQSAYENSLTDPTIKKVRKKITINLTGRSVNFFDTDYSNPITPNVTLGDERLQIKGGKGSMGVVSLFGGQATSSSPLIQQMKNENWLINEANMIFYIDKTAMTNAPEPNRILLYDLDNHRPVIDYYNDLTTSVSSKYNKVVHSGIISKGTDERGEYYKVRLTNHIRNIVEHDSTNVRLGLVVTENINNVNRAYLKVPFTVGSKQAKYVPAMSVVNPLGTILYGSNSNVPADKRIKLQVYYTKPD
ncbi:DUF4270 domain-containing protein [Flavobacterium stagni]|uniref:DUF4270 domain-containing protein n=1 Tax=Flavobacterium stagni TaxID=2506421 RepID=A0A4Q1KDI0_9FLAO|nr:DUF4270 domain-containing protein [Flavobacterium stagni]RXR24514.1 DUF4270 domain-containing protein [Flavobacterium stagni]